MCVVATAAAWIAGQRSERRTFSGKDARITHRQAEAPLPGSRGLIALPPAYEDYRSC